MDKLYKFKGNYDHRSTDTNPTLYRDMIDYLDNQNNVLAEAVSAFLWQPETDYIVGAKVITASMPKGCIAECTAKGTSGKAEPTWVKGVVNDNGVEWKVYNPTEYDIKPTANSDKPVTSNGVYNAINNNLNTAITTAKTNTDKAIAQAHHYIQRNTAYNVGDVLTSPNLPYGTTIIVTQSGTTGADEPDWDSIKNNMGGGTDDGTLKFRTESMFQQVLKQAILMAHPVGSIYESTDATSPETLFGGTWEAMEAGRVLVSAGTATTGTVYNAGDKGGEESHTQTPDELVPHGHTIHFYNDDWNSGDGKNGACNQPGIVHDSVDRSAKNTNRWPDLVESTGGGKPFNVMQPYEVVYRWKRIA